MSNEIDKIINYLRLNRRVEESDSNKQNTDIGLTVINQTSTEDFYIETKESFEDFNKYHRLVNLFQSLNIIHLYLSEQGNDLNYYVRRTVTNNTGNSTYEYLNILETDWSVQNDNNFIEYPILFEYNNYFYNTNLRRVVIKSKLLKEVLVFSDILTYNPKDIIFITNGKYEFDFVDHGGNSNTLFANVMRKILGSNNESRDVFFNKKEEAGKIKLIPTINHDTSSIFNEYPYTIAYPYTKKNNAVFGSEEVCLSFSFKSICSFLEFLNQTILLESNYDFDDESNARRKQFKQDYSRIISNFFIHKLENTIGELSYREALMLLYYLPEKAVLALETKHLWLLLERALTFNTINNRVDLDEEDLVIKLIECIDQKETNKTLLLKKLLLNKTREQSYFKILYDKINGDNFIKFVQIIQDIWKKSAFITPSTEQYSDQQKYGPIFLPYESNKVLGLYFTNAKISFTDNDQLIKVDHKTDKKVLVPDPLSKTGESWKPIIKHFIYHPFYPIFIKDVQNQETDIKLNTIIPAFVLKANEDKQFWHNVIKTTEYAVDALTILSGIGNVTKFRYLAQVASRAETLNFVSKAGKTVSAAKKAVAATAAVVEISSGTIGALLKLTGLEDSQYGKSLYEFLFWLELLSLSGELSVAIHNGLKKSAKEIVGTPENRAKFEKELDNLVEEGKITRKEAEEVIEELRRVSEEAGSTKFITKGKHLDDFGKLKQVSKYEDEIRKLDYEDAKFFDDEGKVLSESFSQKNKNSVSFSDNDLNEIIKKAGNNPRKVILSHNHPTSTGISADDIKIVFDKQFGGIRAIAKDGNNYLVKKIGSMDKPNFYKTTSDVVKKIRAKNPDVVKKAMLDRNSKESKQLAQLLVDGLIEELVKLNEIEYIKYM